VPTLSVEISLRLELSPFDQSVLAAILGRAAELRDGDANVELAFCERDGDLQPWDKENRRRSQLGDLYDSNAIWVYGDFEMESPVRPEG
jgi:hypothetical protein